MDPGGEVAGAEDVPLLIPPNPDDGKVLLIPPPPRRSIADVLSPPEDDALPGERDVLIPLLARFARSTARSRSATPPSRGLTSRGAVLPGERDVLIPLLDCDFSSMFG